MHARPVLTLLPDTAVRRLRRAIGAADSLAVYSSPDTLLDSVARSIGAVVVLDPAVLRDDIMDRLVERLSHASCGIVYYCSFGITAVGRVLRCSTVFPGPVVFQGVDDDDALQRARSASLNAPVPALVLGAIATNIEILPAELNAHVVAAFANMPIPPSADELFRRASLRRRTGDRWMMRAQLCPATRLLAVASLARSVEALLAASAESTRRLTARPSDRLLSDRCRRFLGVPPTRLQRMPRTAIVTALTRQLLARD